MAKNRTYFLFILIIIFLNSFDSYAQATGTAKKVTDSVKIGFITRMQEFAKESAKKSAGEFEADKAALAQGKTFEDIKKMMQKARSYLKKGIDTLGAKAQLAEIKRDFSLAGDGVLTNQGSAQTFRNLTASSKIITELLNKANTRKSILDLHRQNLSGFRYELDSLLSLPSLFKFPTDSIVLSKYLQEIVVVGQSIHPIDSSLKQASNNVQAQLNLVNLEVFKLQNALEEISIDQKVMAGNIAKREFENIWRPAKNYRPFSEILLQAKNKGTLTLKFYLQNNIGKLIIIILLFLVAWVYLRSLKNIYIEKELLEDDFNGQLVLKYPVLSAALIVINLFQFIFLSPPFVLNVILWTVAAIILTFLFRKFITPYWMKVWLLMLVLFLISAFDNLILQASRSERWVMLLISISGTIAGIIVSFRGRREELREKWIVISISFMAVIEFGATLANLFGRYNLSKTLLISGYLNVIIAVLFLWTIRLINEGLFLAFNVYTHQDKKLFYLNFDKVGNKVPLYFYIGLIVGWIVLFGRNFAGFDYIAEPLRDFFVTERKLGEYTFTINNLMLFIVIMSISVIISKIVSFFASDNHLSADKSGKKEKKGIGSWLLLVRISILGVGLYLAIAAAGIPLDRITIVLGALGVGIGFGLQTLVNNLVSGLIIAFEKPVNVGDIVDIDGQGGTMKSIGFRSSVISTWEGADVIMPNGDILNSHLTNWSLGGNRKRISILIGIAYDADLQKAKLLLTGILDKEERVTHHPSPVIQYEHFNDSAIDIRIYFWTKQMKDSYATRSDLIMAITKSFSENGIVIPFPQHNIYLHQPDEKLIKKL